MPAIPHSLSIKDIVGVRILEALLREKKDDDEVVYVRINGITYAFEKLQTEDGFECADVRLLTKEDKPSTALPEIGKILRFGTRCTRGCGSTCREHHDVLYAAERNGTKVYFQVGTDWADEYEPGFIFEWSARGKSPAWMKP